jgi:hypothetical protein
MWRIFTAALAATMLMAAGCGASAEAPPGQAAEKPSAAAEAPASKSGASAESPRERPRVRHAHCGPGAGNCAAVTGRVIYVEAVDPDGDGDAHYVLAGGHVTAPGLSVIDIERTLRPRRLPHAGDLVSAAGPVSTGSYGQSQIEAVELHYQRRRGFERAHPAPDRNSPAEGH